MPTFGAILQRIQQDSQVSAFDRVRREYLLALHELTGRNVVVYYSGWLAKNGPQFFSAVQINDEDKHGFMATFAGLDFERGLDLVLHTPGGDVAATESIIDYLRSKFGTNIRVIVPQISMSGGTMIALAANEIVMGSHSNLGPIDPQIGGRPAFAILAEFQKARTEIEADPKLALLWQPILQQYAPTLLSAADQSIKWAKEIGAKTLREGLFYGQDDAEEKASQLVDFLLSHDLHHAHGRHLHRGELSQRGLNIRNLENDAALQDAVLSVHHACMLTVGNSPAAKLIENHKGIAHVKVIGQIQVPIQMQQFQQAPSPMPLPVPLPPPAPAPTPVGIEPAGQQSPLRRRTSVKRTVAVAKRAVANRPTKVTVLKRLATKKRVVTKKRPATKAKPARKTKARAAGHGDAG
ncbi:hypothetical protein [Bradyrhizobium sp. 188]|uniref:SDH family Clp fold serine proteinase n=1 Tax=Bradyrhizobium sp. 188 TaxID=2782656 RepID=UPI001FF9089A|nr:hypothetical protein [Bradyrhizobium sp. 188]MCK1503146.1 S49 family peptidase [Bradyrhizobium sp. 188]